VHAAHGSVSCGRLDLMSLAVAVVAVLGPVCAKRRQEASTAGSVFQQL